ncbi:DUF4926 domain-containing protein [Phormidesmis priestleyi]
MTQPNLLDTVALLQDLPRKRLTLVESDRLLSDHLPSGLVGTIVQILDETDYLIEFSDSQGCEYAVATLKASEFLVLRYELVAA